MSGTNGRRNMKKLDTIFCSYVPVKIIIIVTQIVLLNVFDQHIITIS